MKIIKIIIILHIFCYNYIIMQKINREMWICFIIIIIFKLWRLENPKN